MQPLTVGHPILIKHKYLEHQPEGKVREVIGHGSRHFKSLARKMSRCISVPWKFVTSHPSSIEVLAMHEIKGFVETGTATRTMRQCLVGRTRCGGDVPQHTQTTHNGSNEFLLVPPVT